MVKRKTVYRLWLQCRRTNPGSVSLEDLIQFQPHLKERLTYYDECIDGNGKESLNAWASNQRKKEQKAVKSIKGKKN